MEKVSVIIPTYNRENSINESIKSVLNQTYNNLEIIVVDDGSTDNTENIIKKINDSRIRYIKLDSNKGACYARNVGIKKATGKYITFNDSDDIFHKTKIEKQLMYLKEKNSDLNFCRMKIHLDNRNVMFPFIENKNGDWIIDRLCKGNIISTQTILAKTSIFKKNQFDERLPRWQDYDLVLRIAINYKISYLEEVLVDTYRNDDNISNDDEKLKKTCMYMIKKDYNLNESQTAELNKTIMSSFNEKELYQLREKINIQKNINKQSIEENKRLKKENNFLKREIERIISSKRWRMISNILKIFGK